MNEVVPCPEGHEHHAHKGVVVRHNVSKESAHPGYANGAHAGQIQLFQHEPEPLGGTAPEGPFDGGS